MIPGGAGLNPCVGTKSPGQNSYAQCGEVYSLCGSGGMWQLAGMQANKALRLPGRLERLRLAALCCTGCDS